MKGQRGFTLIELLIVIAILVVLSATAIPNLSKFVGSDNKPSTYIITDRITGTRYETPQYWLSENDGTIQFRVGDRTITLSSGWSLETVRS